MEDNNMQKKKRKRNKFDFWMDYGYFNLDDDRCVAFERSLTYKDITPFTE